MTEPGARISGVYSFALNNPYDSETRSDLPILLRRVADEIEGMRIDPETIEDLVTECEITEEGPWWTATVYWIPKNG